MVGTIKAASPTEIKTASAIKIGDPKSIGTDTIKFKVMERQKNGQLRENRGVSYFQDRESFCRDATLDHKHDFRWVLDFDGPEFYDISVKLKPEMLIPKITINNGIFYVWPTYSTFKRKAPGDEYYLGHIARFVLANIYLKKDEMATLEAGNFKTVITPSAGETNIIVFSNNCISADCEFDPFSSRKERRNDFHHFYKTFDIPEGRDEFELMIHQVHTPPSPEAAVEPFIMGLGQSFLDILGIPLGTDPAPCGGGSGHSGK
jgi:hypothetical protein